MTQQDHISRKRVVYTIDGMERVTTRKDVPYGTSDRGPFTMDVYYPLRLRSDASRPSYGGHAPVVLFVTGFSDRGAEMMIGCKFKEMGSYVSWAELVAASGCIAITYANEQPDRDVIAVLQYIRDHAGELQVDASRIGIWSASGNVPNALALAMRERFACAALFYPYTLDLDGGTEVANAQALFRFLNAAAGKSAADWPRQTPLFVARAGRDEMPGLNQALDRFITHALGENLPITVMNHAHGPHAFDLFDDSPLSREIVRQGLAFLRFHLSP